MGRRLAVVAVVLLMGTSPLYAQDALFRVTTASADVHKTPSTGSPVIGKAPRGKTLEVTRELGSWVRVSWPEAENGVGYVHVTWGTISRGEVSVPASPAAPAAPAAAEVDSPSEPASTTAALQPLQVAPGPGTSTQAPGPGAISRVAPSLPSHVIGLGALVGTRAIGFAATARAWTYGPLGMQIEAGRSTYTNAIVSGQMRSVQFAPSVIYSLPNQVTNAVWARPYIGAGVNVYRATFRSTIGLPDVVDSGVGSLVFGGAEFTSARLPQLALSADFRHQRIPSTFSGFELGGFGFSTSAHWYVK